MTNDFTSYLAKLDAEIESMTLPEERTITISPLQLVRFAELSDLMPFGSTVEYAQLRRQQEEMRHHDR
jgi:hypothetical protein